MQAKAAIANELQNNLKREDDKPMLHWRFLAKHVMEFTDEQMAENEQFWKNDSGNAPTAGEGGTEGGGGDAGAGGGDVDGGDAGGGDTGGGDAGGGDTGGGEDAGTELPTEDTGSAQPEAPAE